MELANIAYVILFAVGSGILLVLASMLVSVRGSVVKLASNLKAKSIKELLKLDMSDPFTALIFESFKKFGKTVRSQIDETDDVFINFVMSFIDSLFAGNALYAKKREVIKLELVEFLTKVVDTIYSEIYSVE